MSIIGEFMHEINAKNLEEIILDLMKDDDWKEIRSVSRGIAKTKLYPWYLNECADAYINPNPKIVTDLG